MIQIDQRSKESTYVIAGNITIYIEHSPNCAEEYVDIWETDTGKFIHRSSWDSEKIDADGKSSHQLEIEMAEKYGIEETQAAIQAARKYIKKYGPKKG